MRNLALALTAAVGALTIGTGAQAAIVVVPSGPTITGDSGVYSGRVTCAAADAPCSFTQSFSFLAPAGYTLQSAGIGSNFTDGNTLADINFTSVTLNGVAFATVLTGQQEFRNLLNQALLASNTLIVSGTAGNATGADATFAGTLSFGSSAVPEPATWAMMLVGFGAVGFGMRRRRSANMPRMQAA